MPVHLARDDSLAIPISDERRTLPLRWFRATEGPLISDPHGCLGNLSRHGIRASGEVYPSVLLPATTDHEEWHVYVVLDGWDGGDRPERLP